MVLQNEKLPSHIALIMDGNRRWARKKGLSPLQGHREGEKRIEPIVDRAIELGISYLTFWAFSTENWERTKREVEFLLKLYRKNFAKTVDHFHRKNVRLRVIGNLSMFPRDIQRQTSEWTQKTKGNTKITVNIALSYGGRDELLRAIRRMITAQLRNAALRRLTAPIRKPVASMGDRLDDAILSSLSKFVTTEEFENYLDTAGQPDPDLLIRTGGELRLSGFMSWQIAYSELYFTETFWPEFTVGEFDKAILEYQRRQRRFGR